MSYITSWSGGKDCCLACYNAIQKGYKISHLVNFFSKKNHRTLSHGLNINLIQLQAESMGIELIQKLTTWEDYEKDFKKTIQKLIPNHNIKGIIFGDIYIKEYQIQKHKEWAEKICNKMGIKAIEPLWGKSQEEIIQELFDENFEVIIISVRADLLDKKWIGQKLDRAFIQYLKIKNIDICGEKGEYHTLITNCSLFKKKINIDKSRLFKLNGFWILDIIECSL